MQPSRGNEEISAFETKDFACLEGKPHVQKRAHWHSEIEINLLSQGRITYFWHDRMVTIEAQTLVLFWAGMPHQVIRVEGDVHCHWVYIPLDWFLHWKLPEVFTHSVLSGRLITDPLGARFAGELATFQQWHADMTTGNPDLRQIVLLELTARLHRLALRQPTELKRSPGRLAAELVGPVEKLEAMIKFMAREYSNPVSLAKIAATVDLHPNYACSLFRRACGISLHTYLTSLRISHAQRLLVTTDMKIIDIALDAGFASLSRFYAAFNAACKCSPRLYQKTFRRLRVDSSANPAGLLR